MKGKGLFRKSGLMLAPVDREAREIMAAVKQDANLFVDIWLPRNMAQHRKYFALLNNVVEATGRWTSTEHLRRDILVALHRFDEHVNQFTGEVEKIVHSMALASMPKAEFERLYDDTMRLLTDALGCDPEMLLDQAA